MVARAPDAEAADEHCELRSNYTYIRQIPTSPNCGAQRPWAPPSSGPGSGPTSGSGASGIEGAGRARESSEGGSKANPRSRGGSHDELFLPQRDNNAPNG